MAGGFGFKFDPKKFKQTGFTSEVIKDSQAESVAYTQPQEKKKIKFGGMLGLGQTIELSPERSQPLFTNHLIEEEKVLLDHRQKEVQKAIQELKAEIQQLIKSTDGLQKDVEKIILEPITDVSSYQIGFLERLKIFIVNFRLNISQASIWVETFAAKKKKRNHFWTQVKSKKGGGEQYLFSNEHSAARSAT